MKNLRSILHDLRRSESGQTLPIIAILLVVLLGMVGIALDVGHCLYAYRELQATTDAAALAGAAQLPASNAIATAIQYSGVSGNLNAKSNLPGVTMVSGYPKILCLSTLTAQGMNCTSPGNGNAIQVRQQVTVSLTFLRVLGKTSLNLAAVATASSEGAARQPYNVAIIIDTTGSMGSQDKDVNCADTRLNCALAGVRVLLQNLSPCAATQTTCGTATNGNVANPVDRVALYTFPALYSATDAQHEYDCSGTTPQVNYYTDTGFSSNTQPIYQVLDFSTDYKSSASTTTLNPNSNLVKAVGGVSGCGMKPLNMYTYIAGVMYKAGTDLINQQSAYPKSQSVVIILTDGDMNTPAKYMPNASTTSGSYASTINQCAQAVSLAGYAAQYNIQVYSIAYGAAASGCSTDSPSTTPCATVRGLASATQNFYSDYTATGADSSCVAPNSTTNLKTIFSQIATQFSTGRLISDNTT